MTRGLGNHPGPFDVYWVFKQYAEPEEIHD